MHFPACIDTRGVLCKLRRGQGDLFLLGTHQARVLRCYIPMGEKGARCQGSKQKRQVMEAEAPGRTPWMQLAWPTYLPHFSSTYFPQALPCDRAMRA